MVCRASFFFLMRKLDKWRTQEVAALKKTKPKKTPKPNKLCTVYEHNQRVMYLRNREKTKRKEERPDTGPARSIW